MNADGNGKPVRLTNNAEEERAPSWSPDGKRIVFCCRRNGPDFEICIMNADGTGADRADGQCRPGSDADLVARWPKDCLSQARGRNGAVPVVQHRRRRHRRNAIDVPAGTERISELGICSSRRRSASSSHSAIFSSLLP